MIAPISHSYPPSGYGPWERVTHDLTEELVSMGQDVTLFAPEGSLTNSKLIPTTPAPLSESPEEDARIAEQLHLAQAFGVAAEERFDIIHSHLHVHALPFSRLVDIPVVSTLHGVGWNPAHHRALRMYADRPFIALSETEKAWLPELNYAAKIHHGIREADFELGAGLGGYLAFVGRLAPEKAPDLAVEVARRSGKPLILAGPIDPVHQEFGTQLLATLPKNVDYVGPLDRVDVAFLLEQAEALIMPLRWDEPFGLVVIESLAVGTPVIAWRRGAMPEIIADGVSGFLVDDVAGALASIDKLDEVSRVACRSVVGERFSAARMAADHVDVYARLVDHVMASRI